MEDTEIPYINEALLSNIIISESIKPYHTKNVDKENNTIEKFYTEMVLNFIK